MACRRQQAIGLGLRSTGMGATGVKLTGSRTRAVSRLVKGEVAAAVLGLVSPDAAGSFPEVAGFRTLRIPLAR